MKATHLRFTLPDLTAEQKMGSDPVSPQPLTHRIRLDPASRRPLTEAEKTAWTAYRQTLRDIPESFTTPDEVTFPDQPG